MDAVGVCRQGHVQPVVDEHARPLASPLGVRNGGFGEGEEGSGGQILFPNLHAVHTRRNGAGEAILERAGFRLGTVRNVVKLQLCRHS